MVPWQQDVSPIPTDGPGLPSDVVDVCVVGAGISGLSVAYRLLQDGLRVVVLDDGPIAGGMTSRTTAHVSSALDDGFARLERLFGTGGLRLAIESHVAALDGIERIAEQERIACDLERVDGWLFAPTDDDAADLAQEFAAARRGGIDVEHARRAPIPSGDTGPALRFPRQMQLHLLKYCAGLARVIRAAGGRIASPRHVREVRGGDGVTIMLGDGVLHAKAAVVATHVPIAGRESLRERMVPTRTYVIAGPVPRGAVPAAQFWDTAQPYHYVRLAPDPAGGPDPLLLAGGEDHPVAEPSDPASRYAALEAWTRRHFPLGEVRFRWPGVILEPLDSLGMMGPVPRERNVYVVTGDSGHGIAQAWIAAEIIADELAGRTNAWAALYRPSRPPAAGR